MSELLKRSFRQEFLNRLDEIVFYKPLTKDNVTHIIDLLVADLNRRLADQQLTVELTADAKSHIIDAAYDPIYGARPLRRYLQHTVETLIGRKIIALFPNSFAMAMTSFTMIKLAREVSLIRVMISFPMGGTMRLMTWRSVTW